MYLGAGEYTKYSGYKGMNIQNIARQLDPLFHQRGLGFVQSHAQIANEGRSSSGCLRASSTIKSLRAPCIFVSATLGEEIENVVIVVCRVLEAARTVAIADARERGRAGVGRIRRRLVVLEPGVVRDVVGGGLVVTRHGRVGLTVAAGGAVRGSIRKI